MEIPEPLIDFIQRTVKPTERKNFAKELHQGYQVPIRKACKLMSISTSYYYYTHRSENRNSDQLVMRMRGLKPDWEKQEILSWLAREGHEINVVVGQYKRK